MPEAAPTDPGRDIEALFGEAVDLPPEAREAFLRSRCADSAVRRRVEALLEHDRVAGDTFLSGVRADEIQEPAPERVSGYRIVRLIGEGGMGLVYEARQDHPDRAVALKLIRPGVLSRAALRRFQAEGEMLGRLTHPGIARVYEAGQFESPSGRRPFLAMELISGEPLDRHCRSSTASVRRRVELIARVCEAVHHAHTRGVIHRDLKPANIFVEDDGEPRILDFGIARLVQPDTDQPKGSLLTGAGQLLGTLPYMSPEQVSGDPSQVDARTDVYALGVILYELLAGRAPVDVSEQPLVEAIRRIREDEPTRLGAVSRVFAGDLETIVGRALAKEPGRRYASAAELREDLRRYLGDEPIRARPTSTFYQLRKFARRNRGLVAGVAAALVALSAGVVGVSLLAAREHDARVLAEVSREAAERNAFRASMAAALGPLRAVSTVGASLASLDDAPEHLRGWEWRLARRVVDPTFGVIPDQSERLPDGRVVRVRLESDGRVHAVDTRSGTPLSAWAPELPDRTTMCGISPNGTVLMRGDSGFELRDLATGRAVWADPPSTSRETWFYMSPDRSIFTHNVDRGGARLVRRTEDGTVIWRLRPRSHELPIISPDNRYLSSAADIFDLRTGLRVRETLGITQSFNQDSTKLIELRMGATPTLVVVETVTGRDLLTLPTQHVDQWLTPLAMFTEGERTILASTKPGVLQSVDAHTGEPLGPPVMGLSGPLMLSWRDGLLSARTAARSGGSLIRAELPASAMMHSHLSGRTSARISPDGARVARGDWGMLGMWDSITGELLWRRPLDTANIFEIAFSPSGSRVAATIGRGLVAVLDADDGDIRWLPQPADRTRARALSWRDDTTLAAAYDSGTLLLWDVSTTTDQPLASLDSPADALAFSPDGSALVARVNGARRRDRFDRPEAGPAPIRGLFVWDMGRRSLAATRELPPGEGRSLAFRPDGQRLAIGVGDAAIVLDREWRPVGRLTGSSSPLISLRWTPSGQRVLGGAADGRVLIWDRTEGEQRELCGLDTETQHTFDVALRPDESSLVASFRSHTACWDIAPLDADRVASRVRAARAVAFALSTAGDRTRMADRRAVVESDLTAPAELRADALEVLRRFGDTPGQLNSWAWATVAHAGKTDEEYRHALELAQEADRLLPGHHAITNTLGYAWLRVGEDEQAIRACAASEESSLALGMHRQAVNWTAIAIAHHRLGRPEEAAAALRTARDLLGTPGNDDADTRALLAEAEAIVAPAADATPTEAR